MPGSNDHPELNDFMIAADLLSPGESFSVTSLTGGVSCDVWKVEVAGRKPIVVKQALAKLRVAADWQAPPERSTAEVAWLKLANAIVPGCAPEVVAEDRAKNMFAMAYLEPSRHPLWKMELAAGRVDVSFAGAVGKDLALIHAHTAGREDIARAFANDSQFHALRLDPYLYHTARANPDVAPQIEAIAQGIAQARIALMQGDISPKNILHGPSGPVFLDAETSCYGDPVFDLGFCLNHLLLKCIWHPEYRKAYLESFRALKDAYLAIADWEAQADIEARAARLLAVLLLARVDGKSPVEYLTAPRDKTFVRETAKGFIQSAVTSLDAIAGSWGEACAAFSKP